jgi:hypothetical protein
MKTMGVLIGLMVMTTPSFAIQVDRTENVLTFSEWSNSYEGIEDIHDGETIKVLLPYVRGMKANAEITERNQIIGTGDADCAVLSAGKKGGSYEVVARLGETNNDSGYNSCVVTISAKIPGQSKPFKVQVEYGYHIED